MDLRKATTIGKGIWHFLWLTADNINVYWSKYSVQELGSVLFFHTVDLDFEKYYLGIELINMNPSINVHEA